MIQIRQKRQEHLTSRLSVTPLLRAGQRLGTVKISAAFINLWVVEDVP